MSLRKWIVGSSERAAVGDLTRWRSSRVCRVLSAERGIALVTVLLFMAVLVLLGTAFLTLSSTETQIAFNERSAVQAFFLAEAGANKAISQLNADATYTGETDSPLGAGTFTVTVDAIPTPAGSFDRKRVASFGYVPNSTAPGAMARVEVVVERGSPFRWAAFGRNGVEFATEGLTDSYDSETGTYDASNAGAGGDIGSNSDVNLKKDVTIGGDAIAGARLQKEADVVITGLMKENAPPHTLASVSIPAGSGSNVKVLKEGSEILSPGSYGMLRVENNGTITLHPGIYSFYGKIWLKKGAGLKVSPSGKVKMYLTDEFRVDKDVRINADPSALSTNLLIYSSGNRVWIDRGAIFYGAIYAPDADIRVKKLDAGLQGETPSDASTTVFGTLIGKQIDVGMSQRLHFDEALLKEKSRYGPFRPVAGTWREVVPSS
ncbi:MAG: PilX N-terminal domain-containing pilus assembly protein [Candidatus Methylomirabilales bacterium]